MAGVKKNCPWCGIANASDASVCVGCGSDLAAGTTPAADVPKTQAAREQGTGGPQKMQAAREPGTGGAAKAQQKESAKVRKQPASAQIWPGYVYAGIAAAVILGYLYLKNDAAVPPEAVPQNAALMQSDSSGERIASMEKFVAANPKNKEALLTYANLLHDARLFPRAIAAYKQYLDVEAKNPDARVDMAICLFESGDADASLVQLKKALDYAPTHQPAMFNMGIVYLNQEKIKESNDWFSRCAAVDPATPLAARAKQLLSQHSLTNTNLQ